MSAILEILLVEDSVKHATAIEEQYLKGITVMKQAGYLEKDLGFKEVTLKWLKGAIEEKIRNEEYRFYDKSIFNEIEDNIKENDENGIKTGILLDVFLTKDECEKASVNNYGEFKMAKGIYERFHQKVGIYVVTSIRDFGSKVLGLMGTEDLLNRYISKSLVIDYPHYGAMARTIRFMYNGEDLEEVTEDKFDILKGRWQLR